MGELPNGYVPISHAVFDRIIGDTGVSELTARLDDGTRLPAPNYPADFAAFVEATSTETFEFVSVTVDPANRSYLYRWRSGHRTEDDHGKLTGRPDKVVEVSPWGPFRSLPFRERGDLNSRLMSRAAATWNERAEFVLEQLAGGEPFFGRIGSLTSAHQPIGGDLWDALIITDWESGTAETQDSSVKIVSLHGPAVSRKTAKTGRPSSKAKVIAAIHAVRPTGDYENQERLRDEVAKHLGRTSLPPSSLKAALKAIRETGC
jgi:hypothetical protein